jgi:DNA-binding LacI/PurR family transcriptional regulator
MTELARLANVSIPTVSRALHGSDVIGVATRERILKLARKHGYLSRSSQLLDSAGTETVAVVVDLPLRTGGHLPDTFTFELLADVTHGLSVRSKNVMLVPRSEDIAEYERIVSSRTADGIIFIGQGRQDEALKELGNRGVPFVAWGAVSDASPYCIVGSDNVRGGMLVGRHFATLRRKRILFVGDSTYPQIQMRRTGLANGLAEAASDAVIADLPTDYFSFEIAHQKVRDYLSSASQPPDAVFAASDTLAMAAVLALLEHDLKIPKQVSVVGYNDISYAALFDPPLTTVRQDIHQAGALLVEKFMQILDGAHPPSVKLPTELIVRKS